MNWHEFLWRGLSDQARVAARKLGNKRLKIPVIALAARYMAMAVRVERTKRDQKDDKGK